MKNRTDCIIIEADTKQHAKELVKLKIPKGWAIRWEEIKDYGIPKTHRCIADSLDEAFNKAQEKIKGLKIEKSKVLSNPEFKRMNIQSFNEEELKNEVKRLCGNYAIIKSHKIITIGRKGFLGLGKEPNNYEVEIFIQAVVQIKYNPKVKIVFHLCKASEIFGLCPDCGEPWSKNDKHVYDVLYYKIFWICNKCGNNGSYLQKR
jgi:hypothetical protein